MYTAESYEIFNELAKAFIAVQDLVKGINMMPHVFVTLQDEAELEARATSYNMKTAREKLGSNAEWERTYTNMAAINCPWRISQVVNNGV
jgi:hypothetical protein